MEFKKLSLVYLAGFLLAAHFASVSYINSSFLGQFTNNNTLGFLYIFGSILGIILLLLMPFVLRKYGSVWTFLLFLVLELIAILGMSSSTSGIITILFFIVHLSVNSSLFLCLDINLEQKITTENTTGQKRGVMLMIANIAWVISPLALVFLINQNSFSKIYFFSGLTLIPIIFLVSLFFKNTKKTPAKNSNVFKTIKSLQYKDDRARILGMQFMLNFFYSWMVIYLPLLLNKEVGFGWDKIGLLFPIMLLPFLLLELPAGILGDKKIGEKEILITGLLILSAATFIIPTIITPLFWIWALVLFLTRVGASLIEVSAESYFFKHVKEEDTDLISLFRLTRPLAYVIAPIFALPVIYFYSYSVSFGFLAIFMLLGLFFIPKIDTR